MSGMNGMGMGMNSYSSPYSSYNSYSSPYSSMSSPYSRYGGYGSGYGVGSGYGGYGGYGMGGMSTGMGGVFGQGDLARNMEASTQQAFSVLESIVMAVQGLAGMLESTLTATHTSFMAMVSVAEQFGNLRSTLGGVVGVFGLLQGLRDLAYRVIGWRTNSKIFKQTRLCSQNQSNQHRVEARSPSFCFCCLRLASRGSFPD